MQAMAGARNTPLLEFLRGRCTCINYSNGPADWWTALIHAPPATLAGRPTRVVAIVNRIPPTPPAHLRLHCLVTIPEPSAVLQYPVGTTTLRATTTFPIRAHLMG